MLIDDSGGVYANGHRYASTDLHNDRYFWCISGDYRSLLYDGASSKRTGMYGD